MTKKVQFESFLSRYDVIARERKPRVSVSRLVDEINIHELSDNLSRVLLGSHFWWHKARRPYVRVYPPMIRMIRNTRLSVDTSYCHLPDACKSTRETIRTLAVMLPKSVAMPIRSGLFMEMSDPEPLMLLTFACDPTLADAVNGYFLVAIKLNAGSIEQQLDRYDFSRLDGQTLEAILFLFKAYAVFCCIDHDDVTLLQRDVLSSDRDAFSRTLDPALVDKAQRQGVKGWSLGRDIEISPHFRRPHLAVRWTGRHSAIPKIVPVRGTTVNRRTMKVPEGHLDCLEEERKLT